MGVISSRIFLQRRRVSKFLCKGDRMHELGGNGVEGSCGVWWIGGTAKGNGDGFLPSVEGR